MRDLTARERMTLITLLRQRAVADRFTHGSGPATPGAIFMQPDELDELASDFESYLTLQEEFT